MPSGNGQTRTRSGLAVVAAGVSIFVVAALVVAVVGEGQIRFSADTADTIPMWQPWLAAAVGTGLMLVTPTTVPIRDRAGPAAWVALEAFILLALALTFTVALTLLGPEEPNYIALKLGLLLLGPLLMFAVFRRRRAAARRDAPAGWWPLVPALGWAVTYLALSLTHPRTGFEADTLTVIAMVLIGFLLNAVVEELFYRRWLQTRWERVLGGVWPAIIVSSLTWASWHIAIQGTGDWVVDLANVVANQGVTGLFLGLLWQRHRAMWPLLLVHGLMNANPLALF
ncbi:CPBP family intramembrane metalloprotease [Mycolicibacterium vaccae]|nr:CPBP family intramembrane metalloprotease [Mycolicibacterium vaccae]